MAWATQELSYDELPDQLRSSTDLHTLYVRGEAWALHRPAVAVFGTRHGSEYGLELAGRVAAWLCRRGIVVISGLAKGVDKVAHEACLSVGGRTVAVMAHGLDIVYPSSHTQLSSEILRYGGALVSEHPDGTLIEVPAFPRRNRIQTGLSLAAILIESAEVGGSMHTCRWAAKQGRPLLVLDSPHLLQGGIRRAIGEFGAVPVSSMGALESCLKSVLEAGQTQRRLDELR